MDVQPTSGLRKRMVDAVHGFSPVVIIGEALQASYVSFLFYTYDQPQQKVE